MAAPTEPLPPEVLAAFQRGQPIQAIKLLLQYSARPTRGRPPTARPPASPPPPPRDVRNDLAPGEVPRTGTAIWDWLAAGLLAYLAWRGWRG